MKKLLIATIVSLFIGVTFIHTGCATTAMKETAKVCLDAYTIDRCNKAGISTNDQARCLKFVNNGRELFK